MLPTVLAFSALAASQRSRRNRQRRQSKEVAACAAVDGGSRVEESFHWDEPPTELGAAIRSHFSLAWQDGDLFVNHGSFGATPNVVLRRKMELERECEARPDRFNRQLIWPRYQRSVAAVASLVGARADDIALVRNVTEGSAAAVKSVPLSAGDSVLMCDWQYGAVQRLVEVTAKKAGATIRTYSIGYPYPGDDAVEESVLAALRADASIKLVLLDHIISEPMVVLPIARLVAAIKAVAPDVFVHIDGAHAVGQLPLDLSQLERAGVDSYTSNVHKWLFGAKGSAFLWVAPAVQEQMRPIVESHYSHMGFQRRFYMQGTKDESSLQAVATAVRFYKWLGGYEAVAAHCKRVLKFAVEHMVSAFDSKAFPAMSHCAFMANVRMPSAFSDKLDVCWQNAVKLALTLRDVYAVWGFVSVLDGDFWLRLSVSVYNTEDDFRRYTEAVLAMADMSADRLLEPVLSLR